MTDLEKYTPTTTLLFFKDGIEMRGGQQGRIYTVYAFVDGSFKCKMGYYGNYDKVQVDVICTGILNRISPPQIKDDYEKEKAESRLKESGIVMKPNGDIWINKKLCSTDKEIADGLREYMNNIP